MDLAKIRKKSLQARTEAVDNGTAASSSVPELIRNTPDSVSDVSASVEVDFFQKEEHFTPASSVAAEPHPIPAILRERAAAGYTPMEAILAGRIAAGCDSDAISDDDAIAPAVVTSALEFLSFRVSDEMYGINIMDIKEIITPREVTEVPRAPLFVSGVLSLRGTIIPIIDMHLRLGLTNQAANGKERIIVIKNKNSFSGLLVDEVIKVVQVQQDAVEAAPIVLEGIDRDFVSGLGRSEGRLMIILNLANIADIDLY